MFFSVIVPVYNVEQYLKRCLDSLVSQTCEDKEIILVDDGSTDSSGSICEEYAKAYDFVRVIHQTNHGLSGARNTGVEHATGEWLSFVDSDDYVDIDMLEQLQGYILATDADMYRFGFTRGNETEHKKSLICPKQHTITTFRSEQQQFQFYSDNYYLMLMPWRGVYRHSIISEHSFRFEDTLFNYQYFLHVRSLVSLPFAPYHYIRHEGSLLSTMSPTWMLLRCITLGEREYQATVEQGMSYFQENFYKHYFRTIDMRVWNAIYMQHVPEEDIRAVLAEMMNNDFHRRCVEKALQEGTPHVFLRYSPSI